MADIKHLVTINVSPETVYRAVTEQRGIAGWWAKDTLAKAETGFVNEIKFGTRYHNKMKILKLEENKLVEWECIGGDREWIGTHIIFALNSKNGKTEFHFSHAGWADQTIFYANCNYHWGAYMKSLKDYCEKGRGLPDHDKEY